MIGSLLDAPLGSFFDRTPTGRIMNRLSKDLYYCEFWMSYHLNFFFEQTGYLIYYFILAILVFPWYLLIFSVVFTISLIVFKHSYQAVKESVKVYAQSKSPILSHFQESISGSSSIRAYGREEEYSRENKRLLNKSSLALQMQAGSVAWFNLRIELLALILSFTLCVCCVVFRNENKPLMIILITHSVLVEGHFTEFLRSFNFV